MYANLQVLENEGIIVEVNETHLSIRGAEQMPTSLVRRIQKVSDECHFTPRESDDLIQHVSDVKVWSTLKRVSE